METLLAALLWITLAIAMLGLVATLVVSVRQDGRASFLVLLFGGIAGHQALLALELPVADIAIAPGTAEATALLVMTLGGLSGLWALSRVGSERNAAEELHWDAMEALRTVNELALPGGSDTPLDELLAIGSRRFDLEIGGVLVEAAGEPAALRIPPQAAADRQAIVETLWRYAESSSDRPFIDDAPDPGLPAHFSRVFVSTLYRDGVAIGKLAFASSAPPRRKLTATDKDLLALLANTSVRWINPTGVEAPSAPAGNLNSLTDRLRERLSETVVEFALDSSLDEAAATDIPLEDVAYGLARGARLVSNTGALRVESGSIRPAQGGPHFITLTVSIEDPGLDASVLSGVSSRANASLEALGEQLRAHGGDVSMSVETGVGASMTAFVPVTAPGEKDTQPLDRTPQYLS